MKKTLLFAGLIVYFTLAIHSAEARSGCCSHHGGVCGCGCCDGTPLSSTCAPYYPECNRSSTSITTTSDPTFTPTQSTVISFTPQPTATLTPSLTPTITLKPTKKPTPIVKADQSHKSASQPESFWTRLLKFLHFF